jgi:hypothetical protein
MLHVALECVAWSNGIIGAGSSARIVDMNDQKKIIYDVYNCLARETVTTSCAIKIIQEAGRCS